MTMDNLPPDLRLSDTPRASFVIQVLGEPCFHTEGNLAGVAFRPDGTIVSIDELGVLRHWSPEGRALKRFYLTDLETTWAFAAEASRLASGSDTVEVWDVATGTLQVSWPISSWTTALAFEPGPAGSAGRLAVGQDDGTITLWSCTAEEAKAPLASFGPFGKKMPVSALAWSPRGDYLALATEDRVVRVIRVADGTVCFEGFSHTDRIPSLAWSPDGRLLVSAGWDTSARVWSMETADPLILLNSHADQVRVVAFHPTNPNCLATADSDFDIYLWSDARYGKVGHILRGHVGEIQSLAFSPDGQRLASAGEDRVVHLWDVTTGALLAGPNPRGKHTLARVRWQGQESLASTGGPTLSVFDLATRTLIPAFGGVSAYCVASDPAGRWLAAGGVDHFTRLFDCSQPTLTPKLLEATKPPVGAMAVSPDATLVAHTSPADGLVWIWKTDAAEPLLILIEAADGCTLEGVAFLPDGRHVVVGGIDYLSTGERDGAVCIWDLQTHEKTRTFDWGVYDVAVDPSGRLIAGAGLTEKVYLWDRTLESEEPVFALEGHTDRIRCVQFSPDGSYLLSASDDLTLRIWDVLSGRLLIIREFSTAVQSLLFDASGQVLFAAHADTTISQLDFAKLLDD